MGGTDHPMQAEYMEYMDLDSGDFPNPHCLKSEDISYEEKCVIDSKNSDTGSDRIKTENRLKESRDNKTFAKIESEAMNNLPSPCPVIPEPCKVKIDANEIALDLLPVPCPSVSHSVEENLMTKIIKDTQSEVPHRTTTVKDTEENQEVVNRVETETTVENVKSHSKEESEEENKVTFRRASLATSEMIVEYVKSHSKEESEEENRVTFRRASLATSESPTKKKSQKKKKRILCTHYQKGKCRF